MERLQNVPPSNGHLNRSLSGKILINCKNYYKNCLAIIFLFFFKTMIKCNYGKWNMDIKHCISTFASWEIVSNMAGIKLTNATKLQRRKTNMYLPIATFEPLTNWHENVVSIIGFALTPIIDMIYDKLFNVFLEQVYFYQLDLRNIIARISWPVAKYFKVLQLLLWPAPEQQI